VFIRAIRVSFSPSSAAGVLIAAQVVSIVVLKKSSFVLARSHKLVLIRAIRGRLE
jgi:hypothetical protein